MRKALIVVDVQNDFCPGGSLAVDGGDVVASRISEWLASGGHGYELVIATMDWHPTPVDSPDFAHFSAEPDFRETWPVHCVQGTHGAELHPALVLPAGTVLVRKGRRSAAYSGFEGADEAGAPLTELLQRAAIDTVDVVGLATDYCVRATALDARSLGLEVHVLSSMTAGVAPESTARSIEELRDAGISVA